MLLLNVTPILTLKVGIIILVFFFFETDTDLSDALVEKLVYFCLETFILVC